MRKHYTEMTGTIEYKTILWKYHITENKFLWCPLQVLIT